jgi:hypothetical protein
MPGIAKPAPGIATPVPIEDARLGVTLESGRAVGEMARFETDCTFWLNLAMVLATVMLVWLHREHVRQHAGGGMDHGGGGVGVKRVVTFLALALVLGGFVSRLLRRS